MSATPRRSRNPEAPIKRGRDRAWGDNYITYMGDLIRDKVL